jgi:arylsulfatase A-like enzyme
MPFVPREGIAGIQHPDAKMIRSKKWKLNHYPGHGNELYDLQDDPGEERNLAGDSRYASVMSDLRLELLDWLITADENDQIAPRWLL